MKRPRSNSVISTITTPGYRANQIRKVMSLAGSASNGVRTVAKYLSQASAAGRAIATAKAVADAISAAGKMDVDSRTHVSATSRRGSNSSGGAGNPGSHQIRGAAFRGHSKSYYVGRFRRPRRKLRGTAKMQNVYQTRGYAVTRETFGNVADPNCVYLAASTYNRFTMAEVMFGCLLRKLLKKMDITITHPDDRPNFLSTIDPSAGGFNIVLGFRNTAGVQQQVEDAWLPGNTFGERCQFGACFDTIFAYLNDANTASPSSNVSEFTTLGIYQVNPINEYRLKAELNLHDEWVEMVSKTSLVVQNRTKGAGATGAELDRVDTQPLKGWQYIFNGAVPRTRTTDGSGNLMNVMWSANDAVNLVRAAQLGFQYREPPHPKFFRNTYKQSYIRALQPSQIRKGMAVYKYKGYFNVILRKLRGTLVNVNNNNNISPNSMTAGRCVMLALEEVLNTGSNNNIEVSYENERYVAAYSKTVRRKTMLARFEEGPGYNNLPA